MKKFIIGVLISIFFTANLFAQITATKKLGVKQEKIANQDIKRSFSTDEIGKYHNYVLDILRTNKVDILDSRSVNDLLKKQLPLLDKRFTAEEIDNVMKIYSSPPFKKWLEDLIRSGGSPGPYNPNAESPKIITEVQNQVLESLVKNGETTNNFSDVIKKISSLELNNFNRAVSQELNNNNLSKVEKEYLNVYSSIYKASNEYWSIVRPTSTAIGACWWCVYACDALGGLAGAAGGPGGSIVLGAVFSAASDYANQ